MIKNKLYLLLLVLCFNNVVYPVTLVYNLRVRRIFNIPPVIERIKSRLPVSVVPIYFSRNRHIVDTRTGLDTCEKRRAGGALINLRYVYSKHWSLEATTGIETDHGTFAGSDTFKASRTGFDDVVISGEYRHFIGKKVQLVGYGLAGFPTRREIDRCDRHGPLVGTRIYSLGVGSEASYSFMSELRRSCAVIMQTRFLHGFNRSWFPILPKGSKIQPGNSSDLLLTLQYREKRTIIEGGYSATFFTNQALILPTQKIESDAFVRHGGFVRAGHVVIKGLFDKPTVFGAGVSVSSSKKFDTTTFTEWVYLTVVF